MNKFALTVLEALVLLNVGIALGFVLNDVRGENSIKLCQNYFPKVDVDRSQATAAPASAPTGTDMPAGQPATADAPAPTTNATRDDDYPEPNIPSQMDEPNNPEYADAPFQVITTEQVQQLWKHPMYDAGLYVFVDARNTRAFEAGHIPGAHQCDYYRWDTYAERVIPVVLGAEKVVVYCNGGNCEDSLYVCGRLLEYDIPWNRIYLYKGGWEAWEEAGLPGATGPEKE